MNLLKKTIQGGLAQTIDSIGSTVDKIITSDAERAALKNELATIVTVHAETLTNAAQSVVLAEVNGKWLQRNWRPVLMLAFGFIVIYEYFIANVLGLPKANLADQFWDVLEIGIGGYVIGRSAEKITDSLANNFDKLPGRTAKQ